MTELLDKTLKQIVNDNYKAAAIFSRHGIDFCCKGKRLLQEALVEEHLPFEIILEELSVVLANNPQDIDFNSMSLSQLIDFIEREHHAYVKENIPLILSYLERVALKHGDRFPFMREVLLVFKDMKQDLLQHMLKEEKILFPRIRQIEATSSAACSNEYLSAPVDVLEEEHEVVVNALQKLRLLTNNFLPPEAACTTFRLSFAALKELDEDLHRHIHLENNILYPKAMARFSSLTEMVK